MRDLAIIIGCMCAAGSLGLFLVDAILSNTRLARLLFKCGPFQLGMLTASIILFGAVVIGWGVMEGM